MIQDCRNLEKLWGYVHQLNKIYYPENKLMPILGNGDIKNPRIMFVFINPTARNISSDKNWKGPRFPFVGTKQIWRVFHRAGLFDDKLIHQIEKNADWSVQFTNRVLQFLKKRQLYLTNLVKWTGSDAKLPDSRKVKLFLPILEKEIELVKPRVIVSFGTMPFEELTGKKIRLKDYYNEVVRVGKLKFFNLKISSFETKIVPCYFPVGRGNPKQAIEILKLVVSEIWVD